MNRTRSLTVFICLLLSVSTSFATQNQSPSSARGIENNLPILFEPAASWGDGSVAMVGRAANMTVGFQPAAVVVGFQGKKASQFKIEFSGAQPTAPSGAELQKSQTNYLLGNDPAHWRTHVQNYARVTYTGLYPGIDAVFYGNGHQMEHDFIVYPGADYGKIRMHLTDNARASLARDGALVITLEDGSLLMQKPVIYQEEAGKRQERRGSFRLLPDGDIGFTVAGYDPHHTLVIDPVLSFSTYLSPLASDANHIATDTTGNNYVVGYGTFGFPVTPNAFAGCSTCTTNNVVTFVSKLSADGTTLLYSTVLGGNNFAQPTGLAVDANGNAVVSGWTGATNFPTKFGQPIATPNNNILGFLVSLSADGSSLNYGTLLSSSPSSGLNTDTYAMAVALDPSGNAYVTGETGNEFFTTAGALNQGVGSGNGNRFNVFLAKFSPTGGLLYSAILGIADPQNGGGGPIGAYAITVDAAGDAYVAGQAGTLWPISSNAYLNHIAGSMPYATPFVMKVAPDAKSFLYSTYLDYAYVVTGIAVLQNGNVFVTGNGVDTSYPTTSNAYQQSSSTSAGAFLTELDATGSSLVYSTVVGDTSYKVNGLALDTNGDIWLAAQSSNSQFPLVTPLQSTLPQFQGIPEPVSVLNQFDPTGQTLEFSTFLGGTADGYASSVAIDANHRAHVAGAAGYGMYTTPGVYAGQVPVPGPGYSGATYAYVALVDKTVPAPAVCVSPNTGLYVGSIPAGTFVDRPVTITSCGTLPLTISGASAAASVFTVPASENGCTQTLPVGQSCTLSVRYSPTALETDSSTLTIQSNASIPQTVLPLSGSGVIPVIAVNNTPIFDYTIVGQTSAPQMVIVQDQGGAPLVIYPTKTTVSGDFSLKGLGACGSPFYSCGLAVYFTPTAPGIRTGTLSIGSNDPSHPTISVQLHGVGYTDAPVPEITNLSSQLVQAGVAETNFIVQGYGFLPSSIVEVNGIPQQTTYQSSTFLNATIAASSIPANSYGELTVTVVTPAPGGGTSVPYTLTEFQLIPASSAFMIYEPVSKQLFSSTPAAATANANTILLINPVNAIVGTPIPVGNDPGVLAASADGKYLYVALNGDHTIQRINLSTNAIERTFPLPVDPQFGNLTVSDMHVVPGNNTEVVASLRANASPSEDGIAFFNDGGLVNEIPGLLQVGPGPLASVDRFTFTNDPSTLYAIAPLTSYGFTELSYSSAGLGYVGNSCCIPANSSQDSGPNLATDGTLLYTVTGYVWNPANSGQIVHTYAVPTAPFLDSVIPDASTGKTYFLNQFGQYFQYSAATILAFDQTSLAQTGALSFTGNTNISTSTGTQLVRWGANGFAFRAGLLSSPTSTSILLFTSGITSASNLNPVSVASTLIPTSTPAAGTDFVLTVNGSNFIPGSTVEWNGSPRLTTSVSSTQLTATIYASDIATTGTAQVVVVSPGQGATSAALSFTISAPLAPAPVAVLSPTSLTFGTQLVGTSSSAQTVTLTNSGNADLTGISVALTGADANSFTETSTCGVTVSPGKSCTISVVFTPTVAGNASATVTVTDNAGTSPQSIGLSGTAVAPPSLPGVTLSPASLTFASQLVGTSSSAQTVTMTNSGNADLTGIVIAPTGADANSFTETSTCGITVSAGKSCVISVVFTPTAAGNASATITITDNAGTSPQAIGLSGTAPQPAFVIAAQTGGSTSSTVTPGQPATYPLSITSVNGFSGALTLNCNNLPTNASCTFTPASLTLSGGTAATFTVTIATQTTQTAALVRNVSLGLSLAGFLFLAPTGKKRGHRARAATLLFLFAVAIGVSACGGNASGSGTTVTSQAAVAPGTYTIQVVASDGTTKQMVPLTLIVQ